MWWLLISSKKFASIFLVYSTNEERSKMSDIPRIKF
jgi:hypothetical protein